MAEIVNLRMARKAKARSEAEKQAQANRALHSQTKAARKAAQADAARSIRLLDGHRLDDKPRED